MLYSSYIQIFCIVLEINEEVFKLLDCEVSFASRVQRLQYSS